TIVSLHLLLTSGFLFYSSSFTKLPHLAGTEQNLLLAKKIQGQWKEFGLDSAELVNYDVFNTSLFEPPPQGYENVTDMLPPYNAFSAQGVPE
ncbi:NALD2 dipeptidase, partial [Oxylabes madagascariensis]|nr:NALD2 dipeptidase [Oxylabes madagascariensis]